MIRDLTSIRSLVRVAGCFFLLLAMAAWGQGSPDRLVDFDIPAQPMSTALVQFGKQAGMQVVSSGSDVSGLTARPVKGRLTAREAVARMLESSGLVASFNGSDTLVIRADPARKTSEPAQRGEKITVTGTNIRSGENATSPVITLEREELEAMGQPTVGRALTRLPQNFAGQTDIRGTDLISGNLQAGTSVNLRGLSLDTTLVLVNGRRIARTGFTGGFTDVSGIPMSAVERIEVLMDGASAIYGSDAIGGVVNIILKKDYSGTEAAARYGQSNGYHEWLASGVLGVSSPASQVFLSFEHYYQNDLRAWDLKYHMNNDFRSLGGSDFRTNQSNPGNVTAVDGNLNALSALVGRTVASAGIPGGQNGTNLRVSDFVPTAGVTNLFDANSPATAVPEQARDIVYMSGQWNIDASKKIFADVLASKRKNIAHSFFNANTFTVPATNPFNPFGENVRVAYAFTELGSPTDIGTTDAINLVGGFQGEWGRWKHEVSTTYGRENWREARGPVLRQALLGLNANTDPAQNPLLRTDRATALNVFGDGSANSRALLDLISTFNTSDGTTQIGSIDALSEGPLFSLGRHEARLAVGGQFRRESFWQQQANGQTLIACCVVTVREGDRKVAAAFAELLLPIFRNDGFGLQRLDLSAAARLDDYSDFGNTTNPKIGIAWSPVGDATFRASWSKSFKAPQLREIFEPRVVTAGALTLVDQVRGETVTGVDLISGGNPDLVPEKARTVSAGVNLVPQQLPGLEISLNRFETRYDNKIIRPDFVATIDAGFEQRFPGVIVRAPGDGTRPGRIVGFDFAYRNLTVVKTTGWDFTASYKAQTPAGMFQPALNVAYVDRYDVQGSATAPLTDQLGIRGVPPRLRATASTLWTHGSMGASVFGTYNSDYRLSIPKDSQHVTSYTVWNVSGYYDIASRIFGVKKARITAGVNNVFARQPPFINIGGPFAGAQGGWDLAVADPRGRMAYLEINASF